MAKTYITKYNECLDQICYKYYGSTSSRQVEMVLDANPGLEKEGLLLSANLTITLPTITVATTPVATTIKLWE